MAELFEPTNEDLMGLFPDPEGMTRTQIKQEFFDQLYECRYSGQTAPTVDPNEEDSMTLSEWIELLWWARLDLPKEVRS